MSRWTVAPLLAFWLLGSACATDDAKPADQGRTVAEPATAAGEPSSAKGAIAVSCAMDDAIEAKERIALVARARELLAALREDQHGALWEALHPQAKHPEGERAFLDTLAILAGRVKDAPPGESAVEAVAFGHVSGGVNDLARLLCREGDKTDGPPALTLLVNAGDEDIGYVSLIIPGPVYEHTAVIKLRKHDTWRLLGIQVHPSRFRRRGATEWISVAGKLRRASKLVPAYAALAMAGAMASRGPSVSTPISAAIEEDLVRLREHPLFVAETKAWVIDGQDFNLHGLSLAATQSDVSLVVKYVNRGGLVEELVGRDADKLMDHVRTQYPDLRDIVDAVVFEAYATPPSKAGETVDAFRVARFF
ncbi:MAG: hypothetical protein JKY37_09345 [Nannocystaceae bacterium]|nr:hypothetical protein [Nannocystaceae bacterium]